MSCCLDGVAAAAVVVSVALGRTAFRRRWRGTEQAATLWRDRRPHVWAALRTSPATFAYLGVLVVTAWVLLGAGADARREVLEDNSTNLHHLATDPARVVVRSAFWLGSDYELLLWIVPFVLVLAPAERWLGTARWLVTFVAGHVGATLATALGIWVAVRAGIATAGLQDAVDVGVSYGFLAVAALFSYRLQSWRRTAWLAALLAAAAVGIVTSADFTAYGHVVALTIGLALFPLTRATAVRRRADQPVCLLLSRRQPVPTVQNAAS